MANNLYWKIISGRLQCFRVEKDESHSQVGEVQAGIDEQGEWAKVYIWPHEGGAANGLTNVSWVIRGGYFEGMLAIERDLLGV